MYHRECQELDLEIQSLDHRQNRLATLRLVSALSAIALVFAAALIPLRPLYYLALLPFLIFMIFLHKFRQSRETRAYKQALRLVYQARSDRRGTAWTRFPDNGQALLDRLETAATRDPAALHRYHLARDLDVLGPDSLYQRLSLCFSAEAKQELADMLLTIDPLESELEERQAAVQELADKDSFSLEMASLILLAKQKASPKLQQTADRFIRLAKSGPRTAVPSLPYRLTLIILPLMTLLSILSMLLFPAIKTLLDIALILMGAQLLIAFFGLRKISSELDGLDAFSRHLDLYRSMIDKIQAEDFRSDLLRRQQASLVDEANRSAALSLTELGRLSSQVAARKNSMAWLLGNALFLMDLQLLLRYRTWQRTGGARIRSWLDAIASFEALLSLATANHAYEQSCLPKLGTDKSMLRIEELHHPLIDSAHSVANPVQMKPGATILTGSNMSGKTTYLRSIGLALLLAQAGCRIPATDAEIPLLILHSSVRVDDNVSAGISSFYAEILRIRAMVEAVDQGRPLLLLIDEIFRGTNSEDRITGAKEAIRRLHAPEVYLMVSTHDRELCALEYDPEIRAVNNHFSEYYVDDRIRFDYRLRAGRAQTTNARYLLHMAGIIDAL